MAATWSAPTNPAGLVRAGRVEQDDAQARDVDDLDGPVGEDLPGVRVVVAPHVREASPERGLVEAQEVCVLGPGPEAR